jgi:hypothetical protein
MSCTMKFVLVTIVVVATVIDPSRGGPLSAVLTSMALLFGQMDGERRD